EPAPAAGRRDARHRQARSAGTDEAHGAARQHLARRADRRRRAGVGAEPRPARHGRGRRVRERAHPARPPVAAPRERGVHAAHRLRGAGQLRDVLQRGLRQRRQLRQRPADEHHQPRCAEGASLKDSLAGARWSLLFGNFAIGCGVMVVPGTLNDISRSLQVSVSLAGQLIAIAAAVMCFGAPLLAGWVSGFDRRRLLALSLLWYAVGHALSALMPSYATLWPMRALTMLAAAVFTPQAAAAIGFMTPP